MGVTHEAGDTGVWRTAPQFLGQFHRTMTYPGIRTRATLRWPFLISVTVSIGTCTSKMYGSMFREVTRV